MATLVVFTHACHPTSILQCSPSRDKIHLSLHLIIGFVKFACFFFQLLKQQQEGLKHLVDIIKDDAQDIQLMEQNLEASSFSQR